MTAQAKTINLLLYDGSLTGVVSIEDSSWNSGELYSVPRDSVENLLATDACGKYGVYLLLSNDKVYVGQSSDLAKRLKQHIAGKDWWESAVVLTTKDDSLNHADIDYLESMLINKASNLNKLDCDNKTKGNPPKVDKYRKVFLNQYLEEALFLMQLIGITVFSDDKTPDGASLTIDTKACLAIGKGMKSKAIAYLKEKGVNVGKSPSYSALQSDNLHFWVNPQTDVLTKDWHLVLNDRLSQELIVLFVPHNSFSLKTESSEGFVTRTDKPNQIQLWIERSSLVDKKSGIDLSPYLITRVSY